MTLPKLNINDSLATLAVVALIYFGWRESHIDLAGFGEGFAAIFGGKAAHTWAANQGGSQ